MDFQLFGGHPVEFLVRWCFNLLATYLRPSRWTRSCFKYVLSSSSIPRIQRTTTIADESTFEGKEAGRLAINITRSRAGILYYWRGGGAGSRIRVRFFYHRRRKANEADASAEAGRTRLSAAPGDVPKDIRLRAKIAWRCQRQGWNEKKPAEPQRRASSVHHLLFAAAAALP